MLAGCRVNFWTDRKQVHPEKNLISVSVKAGSNVFVHTGVRAGKFLEARRSFAQIFPILP